MGQTRESVITIDFGVADPTGTPSEEWRNDSVSASSYQIKHTNPTGAPIVLTATAILWVYDRDTKDWGYLEEAWRTVNRTVPAGVFQADFVQFSYARGSALYVKYPIVPTGIVITAWQVFGGVGQP